MQCIPPFFHKCVCSENAICQLLGSTSSIPSSGLAARGFTKEVSCSYSASSLLSFLIQALESCEKYLPGTFLVPEAAYLSRTGISWQSNSILKRFPLKEFHHFQLTHWDHVKCHRAANLCCVGFCWVRGTGRTHTADSEVAKKATDDLWDRPCPIYCFLITLPLDLPPLAFHRAKFPLFFSLQLINMHTSSPCRLNGIS